MTTMQEAAKELLRLMEHPAAGESFAVCRETVRDLQTLASGNWRSTTFVMSAVEAPPNTPVLFVEVGFDMLSLANMSDIERLIRETREAAYDEIQEFVVQHAFDTTVGRRIDDFITERITDNAAKKQGV